MSRKAAISPALARLEQKPASGTTVLDIAQGESLMSEAELDEAEAVVRAGCETYVTVGRALMAIRDGKGYRFRGFTTFELYLDRVWDMRRRQGYRLISAAQLVEDNFVSLRTQNGALPTVTQARILAELPVEERGPLIVQGALEMPTRELASLVRDARSELTERRDREHPSRSHAELSPVVPALPELARPARASILVGDVRAALASLPRNSVHVAISSPPYYGLRSYDLAPSVWGQSCCEHPHEWGPIERAPWANDVPGPGTGGKNAARNTTKEAGSYCQHVHEWGAVERGKRKDILPMDVTTLSSRIGTDDRQGTAATDGGRRCDCGAWLGHLGLEASPDCLAWARSEPPCSSCYVCHMRTVLAALWPVLRADGTLWLNLGDSYSGSGKGPTGWSGAGDQTRRQGFAGAPERGDLTGRDVSGKRGSAGPIAGIRRKNLLLIPERVALAAQADGWIVRSRIPWLKRNSMPESTTDRPSSAVEYVLVLARSERYFWDADAIGVMSTSDHPSGNGYARPQQLSRGRGQDEQWTQQPNRNRRNSDWFFESWQGLLLGDDRDPQALVVNPAPFPGAHFATFSSKLVEPMIRASTSERGVCPDCGAPWERCTNRTPTTTKVAVRTRNVGGREDGYTTPSTGGGLPPVAVTTTGWKPTCTHGWHATATSEGGGIEPIPATVLDPFAGAGSTLLAAARLGRDSIGIELSRPYADMAVKRIQADGGFTVDVELREVPG